MTRRFVACAFVGVLACTASEAAAAEGPPYSLTVRRSHFLRSSTGTLRLTSDGIEYDTVAKKEARRWTYADIQQLVVQSPRQVVVLTYEDQGRLKLGADRRFAFEIREGSVTQEMVAFLLSRTERSGDTREVRRAQSQGDRCPVREDEDPQGRQDRTGQLNDTAS